MRKTTLAYLLILLSCLTLGTPMSAAAASWDGIIAYKEELYYGDPNNLKFANLWYLTPTGNRLISDRAAWYGPVRWSPDNRSLACEMWKSRGLGDLRRFDRNGALLPGTKGKVGEEFQWFRDGRGVISGVRYQGIIASYINGSTKLLMRTHRKHYIDEVTLSLDEKWTYFVEQDLETDATLYRIQTNRLLSGKGWSAAESLATFFTSFEEVQIVPRADGKAILSLADRVLVFDPDTRMFGPKVIIPSPGVLRLSPNGEYIALAESWGVRVIDAETLATVAKLDTDFVGVRALAWSPIGDAIAYAEDGWSSNRVTIWNLTDNSKTVVYHRDWLSSNPRIQASEDGAFSLDWAK